MDITFFEIPLIEMSHSVVYREIMQSRLPRHLNKTFAMVGWALLVDLNTDRRILVDVELQKHSLELWRG